MSNDIESQLKDMAALTVLSNKINPIQEKNLKMFPLVFFDGVKKVTIKYDLSSRKDETDSPAVNNSFVIYDLEGDRAALEDKFEVRFYHLEQAVRQLFWNDIRVRLRFNGELVKESEKNGK